MGDAPKAVGGAADGAEQLRKPDRAEGRARRRALARKNRRNHDSMSPGRQRSARRPRRMGRGGDDPLRVSGPDPPRSAGQALRKMHPVCAKGRCEPGVSADQQQQPVSPGNRHTSSAPGFGVGCAKGAKDDGGSRRQAGGDRLRVGGPHGVCEEQEGGQARSNDPLSGTCAAA